MPDPVLTAITDDLVRDLQALQFGPPVACVYDPLEYARAAWDAYLDLAGSAPGRVLLLGMNPGPWGMAQTGVPFGDVASVRDWLGIDAAIGRPAHEHPRCRVLGLQCHRSEVSGTRVWGWAQARFGTPRAFFARFFIANWCPLCFLNAGGANLTPDKLPRAERPPLYAACDRALRRTVEHLQPRLVVGVGSFAEQRARLALQGLDVPIGRILHPSPASPIANRGWAQDMEAQLRGLGVEV